MDWRSVRGWARSVDQHVGIHGHADGQYDARDAKQYIGSDVHSYASHKDVVFIVVATFLLGIAVISIFLGICFEVHQ